MGKEQHKDRASKTHVLKVSMHCQCNGCVKKIEDGVKDVSLSEGVERVDLVLEKAEVIVVCTMDPDKLCCLLHEVTKKHVKIQTQRTVRRRNCSISANQEPSWPGSSLLICSGDSWKPK